MRENALQYIPQRAPIVMVDVLLQCTPEVTMTEFTVRQDNIFVENGLFQPVGLLENIAQTCASRIGYLNRTEPVRLGVIGGVKDFQVISTPRVGDTLTTIIVTVSEVGDAVIVDAKIYVKGNLIASCNMKVFVSDAK